MKDGHHGSGMLKRSTAAEEPGSVRIPQTTDSVEAPHLPQITSAAMRGPHAPQAINASINSERVNRKTQATQKYVGSVSR